MREKKKHGERGRAGKREKDGGGGVVVESLCI